MVEYWWAARGTALHFAPQLGLPEAIPEGFRALRPRIRPPSCVVAEEAPSREDRAQALHEALALGVVTECGVRRRLALVAHRRASGSA